MAYQQYSLVYNSILAQQTVTLPPNADSPFMNSFAFSMFSVVASAMTVGASVTASSSPLSSQSNRNVRRSLLLNSMSVALLSHTCTQKTFAEMQNRTQNGDVNICFRGPAQAGTIIRLGDGLSSV